MKVRAILETMDYGPAPESRTNVDAWLEAHHRQFELYIDGRWQKPRPQTYLTSVCPSNGEALARIASASRRDVARAVAAAKQAQPAWQALGGHRRARYLYAIARQIQKHARRLAVVESLDNGKPIRESRDIDIPLAARHFYHHAGWAQLMDDELPDHEPLGVVAGIVPWNFPLLILAWKVAPALAAGNTVVMKPAQLTSLSALLFTEICDAVGLPPGVLNLVTGEGRVAGQALAEHPDVAKVTFTGSTSVGRSLRETTAGSGKKLTLELGGKSPFIVFDDADLDSAVEGVVDAIWFNQGQVCCAGSRLLVQENIEELLIRKIKARMAKLRVGDPLDKAIDIGAVVDQTQLETIARYVKLGAQEGAQIWQPAMRLPSKGFYYPPTLCTGVTPASIIAIEEIFGPVLVSLSFRTPAEAVALANNSRYGLAASVWTENINLALGMAPQLEAGVVWINCTNQFDAAAGFGGYKESGYGREGGMEGLIEFVTPRCHREFRTRPFPIEREKRRPAVEAGALPAIDQTPKLFIGGRQARPDSGYTLQVENPQGRIIGDVGAGSRKDIRNGVEAAVGASTWRAAHGHARAQVLFYIAENLAKREVEFMDRIRQMTGATAAAAGAEFALSIERIYYYASYADKYDGRVHHTPFRNVTLAMPEPVGVLGIVCPNEHPLLGFVSLLMPALARGNHVIIIPSEKHPLSATDFYQILETSDLPAGAASIVTGSQVELAEVLAQHDGVNGLWYFGAENICGRLEKAAAGNMKRTWLNHGLHRDWTRPTHGQGLEFLRQATEIKNIWVPYGE